MEPIPCGTIEQHYGWSYGSLHEICNFCLRFTFLTALLMMTDWGLFSFEWGLFTWPGLTYSVYLRMGWVNESKIVTLEKMRHHLKYIYNVLFMRNCKQVSLRLTTHNRNWAQIVQIMRNLGLKKR